MSTKLKHHYLAVKKVQAVKTVADQSGPSHEPLAIEAPLQICINGDPFTMTMRTPGDDRELVRGILQSERIVSSKLRLNPADEAVDPQTGIIDRIELAIAEDQILTDFRNNRSLMSVASCGLCGKKEICNLILQTEEPLRRVDSWDGGRIEQLMDQMAAQQKLFQATGGTHAAALFNTAYEMIALHEDVGRHNAVDKAVGDLLLRQKLHEASVLFVSGRVSYEIVAKARTGGIPVLLAVSAPSSLSVDMAKEFGIQLYAFCRGNKFTRFA